MFKKLIIVSVLLTAVLARVSLNPNECLTPGQSIESSNGCFKLTMQSDGNLVAYRAKSGNSAIWSTGTERTCTLRACMQGDGNFVTYDCHEKPTWSTGTVNNEGSSIVMQDDGNIVIYKPHTNRAVWSSGTVTHC